MGGAGEELGYIRLKLLWFQTHSYYANTKLDWEQDSPNKTPTIPGWEMFAFNTVSEA